MAIYNSYVLYKLSHRMCQNSGRLHLINYGRLDHSYVLFSVLCMSLDKESISFITQRKGMSRTK